MIHRYTILITGATGFCGSYLSEYFKNKNAGNLSQNKLEKTVDALLDGLTCTWENNGNIMADTVRDDVLNVLTEFLEESIYRLQR